MRPRPVFHMVAVQRFRSDLSLYVQLHCLGTVGVFEDFGEGCASCPPTRRRRRARRRSQGAVRCWGWAEGGRLGYGNMNDIGDNELPSAGGNVNEGGPVTKVALGNRHTCALLANGAVRCWGVGSAIGQPTQIGPLGDNETPASKGDVNVEAAGGRPGQPRRQRRTHRRRPVPHLRDPDERLRALLGVQHPRTARYGQLEQRRRQ